MAREKGMGSLQREKSGRWTLRVCIHGKRYARSTRTKDRDHAEKFLQRFLAPLGLGERLLPLADVWLEYLKSPNRNELAKSTLEAKRCAWMNFANWMEKNYLSVSALNEITSEMVAEYLASLRVDLCGTTYNGRVCILREIFRTLSSRIGFKNDPWEGVRLRSDDSHSRRELTIDELRRLLEAAKHRSCSEWHTLFLIGIYTGLRLGDCCRLDWSNVNLAQGVIQIIPQKTRRHAHGRPVTIPIHPTLRAEFANDTSESSLLRTGPILPSICAQYEHSRCRVSDELSRIFKAANITTSVKVEGRKHLTPEATFHSLRHSFVSFAANAGIPLHFVQSIVGHESTAMTRHYYHQDVDGLRSAVAAIPSLETPVEQPHGEPTPHISQPPQTRTITDRLKELDALLKAQTISPSEYQTTRANILLQI